VVDDLGQAYVAGGAHSTDFPTTPGAWDPICDACTIISTDGFAAKLSGDGSTFIYSTTIGSTGGDEVVRVDVDPEGNAYLIGYSRSTVFPVTAGALQSAYGGGDMDVVVVKLNADGSDALYSTYLGGSGRDRGYDIVIDQGSGIAHITGSTDSADFPTRHPLQGYRGGYDAFLAKLNPEGERLLFSTWLGGSGDENFVSGGPVSGGGHGAVALYDELVY
ncbi:MAG: hypothetical protein GY708_04280, partial [Actinomycetia bacterium]|nr:hypothetical protein [Actinomycetes bacterium]